jgi:hypothetical protein
MKLIVTGYARHGKDTVCEMLRDIAGLQFHSSSAFVAEKAVRPWLAARGIVCPTFEEMYADRVNHRAAWYDAISDYCKDDPAHLGKELLFGLGDDIYCGLRNIREFEALQGLVDFSIWVDASKRLPPEPETSITIRPEDCDFILDNNGSLNDLKLLLLTSIDYMIAKKGGVL